ncbi:NUDIX domain-containing protein [Arthrobacter sp. PAMC25284]|nr:NUDIX domain-containing protein [Arthrobacter sp. PAMC25284]
MNPRIVVSAVCVFDAAGRLLTVRKRGTDKFMHPGGKPEAGESAAETAARELEEEVGIVVAPGRLELLGVWLAAAANETATQIEATVFTAPGVWSARPAAEIAEIRWLDLSEALPGDLAPLLTDHVLPALANAPRALCGRVDSQTEAVDPMHGVGGPDQGQV